MDYRKIVVLAHIKFKINIKRSLIVASLPLILSKASRRILIIVKTRSINRQAPGVIKHARCGKGAHKTATFCARPETIIAPINESN